MVVSDEFDWHGDRHLRRSLDETVIYEVHVRGFTFAKSSGVSQPGTYLGLIEKIPYLQSLGVTAVELMPVFEFPMNDCLGQASERPNYWGYDPLAFFAPHRGYAVGGEPGGQVREFKEMVLALHRAGIEVILDVVLNHTAEGNESGPTLSFKGLENRVYYMLENGGGTYRNYSGCGNTLNGNHPIVREMIFHCLRYWVHNYHIDGFRFDLASILSRNRDGEWCPIRRWWSRSAKTRCWPTRRSSPRRGTRPAATRWALSAAIAGRNGTATTATISAASGGAIRTCSACWPRGWPDPATSIRPADASPYHSINFITSHDGFTLNDLVSYNEKHNEANGESNQDGEKNNFSYNYGVEGPTRRRPSNRSACGKSRT